MVYRSKGRGLFSAGNSAFAVIIIQLGNTVIFGKSGFHVTGYFKEAEGIEPGNPIHYAGVDVGMVDNISVETGKRCCVFVSIKMPRCQGMRIFPSRRLLLWADDLSKFPEVIRKGAFFLTA